MATMPIMLVVFAPSLLKWPQRDYIRRRNCSFGADLVGVIPVAMEDQYFSAKLPIVQGRNLPS
jgi:hypothetical protein